MKKVCVVTGTRAEYGLLRSLMFALQAEHSVDLQTVVTGSHLVPAFGNTIQEISSDGFQINETVEMLLASDSKAATATSLGLGLIGLSATFHRLNPDLLILLGDRYEALAAAQAAMMLNIPIAHIHGGEATEGLIDEAIRHSITKMSHIHFVSAPKYAQRVAQLGEDPNRIFVVGAAALDNINTISFYSRKELKDFVGIELKDPIFLVTYHPSTLSKRSVEKVSHLLDALTEFVDATIIFTGSNADPNGRKIQYEIEKFCKLDPTNRINVANLGFARYLSLAKLASAVVGNSSSGIIEAPSLGSPTVNIGDRQRGRLQAKSIISSGEDKNSISNAIRRVLSPDFQDLASKVENPYGTPGAAKLMCETIIKSDLSNILMKKFHDV